MKLSQVKQALQNATTLIFELPTGDLVPSNFHVTEVGKVTKHFIDCGGTVRKEEVVNFQLWNAADYDHRLHPEKLMQIITISEQALGIEDLEIEVEFQGSTIQRFGLAFENNRFLLTNKQTDCLAKDKCGIPMEQLPNSVATATATQPVCTPGGGCC